MQSSPVNCCAILPRGLAILMFLHSSVPAFVVAFTCKSYGIFFGLHELCKKKYYAWWEATDVQLIPAKMCK